MESLERRVTRAEAQAGMDQEPIIHRIVHFGGSLPAEEESGNVIVQHVHYEEPVAANEVRT